MPPKPSLMPLKYQSLVLEKHHKARSYYKDKDKENSEKDTWAKMKKVLPNLAEMLKKRRKSQWQSNGLEAKVVELDQNTTIACFVSQNPNPKMEAIVSHNPNPTKEGIVTHNASPKMEANGKEEEESVLLLLHGMGSDSLSTWDAKGVGELAKHFNMVIAPNLLFFGESITSLPGRSETTQAHAVQKLLQSLGVQKNVVAVGHGYGGQVAFMLASIFPSLIKGFVLVDSALCANPPSVERMCSDLGISSAHEIAVPTSVDVLRKVINFCFHKKMPWLPDMFLKDQLQLVSRNRESKLQLIDGSLLSSNVPSISPPTQDVLIVWGESDRIFCLEDINLTLSFLGDKGKLTVIKEAGHALPLEKPLELNEAILNFCQSLH